MKWIIKIIVVALALLLAQKIVPGISVASLETAFIVAFVLALINLIIRPILLVLTFPITIITFGLFAFILNALLFWLAAAFVPGFIVSSFLAALLGSLIVSVAHFVVDHLFP